MTQTLVPDGIVALEFTKNIHLPRKYMTPGTYQGDEVLIHIGACKETGCDFRAQHLNWDGVDRLVWKHRREHILIARQQYLVDYFEQDLAKIEKGMADFADRQTHTFEDWKGLYNAIERRTRIESGIDSPANESFNLELHYQVGFTAWGAALKSITETLDAGK